MMKSKILLVLVIFTIAILSSCVEVEVSDVEKIEIIGLDLPVVINENAEGIDLTDVSIKVWFKDTVDPEELSLANSDVTLTGTGFDSASNTLKTSVAGTYTLRVSYGGVSVTLSYRVYPESVLGVGPDDAFQTIQGAIDAALDGYTIVVSPGIYEENPRIWKPVSLIGPNHGVTGHSSVRSEEAVILNSTLTSNTIGIYSNDVTISGFHLQDTSNSEAFYHGIAIYASNVSIVNNIFTGKFGTGRAIVYYQYVYIGGQWIEVFTNTGALVKNNLFVGSFHALHLNGVAGNVEDNVFLNTKSGLTIQPLSNTNVGAVKNNTIETYERGIWYNYAKKGSGTWTIENNTVNASSTASTIEVWSGILVQTFGTEGTGNDPHVSIQNNTINGELSEAANVYGLNFVSNVSDTANATITGNTFSNMIVSVNRPVGIFNLAIMLANNTFPIGSAVSGNQILVQ